jgi:hypothetical protein
LSPSVGPAPHLMVLAHGRRMSEGTAYPRR